jgi:protein TonB
MKKSILIVFSLLLYFSCSTKKAVVADKNHDLVSANSSISDKKPLTGENEVFSVVEIMPAIASCGNNDLYNKAGRCTNKKLSEFIYKNLKYPEIGRKSNIVGIVAVKFVVNSDGSINDIGIKCNKIAGTEEERKAFAGEAIKVIEKMKISDIRWSAGVQDGKKVNALYYYPIMFK